MTAQDMLFKITEQRIALNPSVIEYSETAMVDRGDGVLVPELNGDSVKVQKTIRVAHMDGQISLEEKTTMPFEIQTRYMAVVKVSDLSWMKKELTFTCNKRKYTVTDVVPVSFLGHIYAYHCPLTDITQV